jgi:hypothetical protein
MVVIGGDTETVNGEPITLQFFSEDLSIEAYCPVNGKNAFSTFIKFLNSLPQSDSSYTIYCHNLSFDMVSFFYSKQSELLKGIFEFKFDRWKIKGLYKSNCYTFFTHKNGHKQVYLIDTSAFFMGSLENLGKMFCPHLPKFPHPVYLGKRKPNRREEPQFRRYAMRDAEICFYIGKSIQQEHFTNDIRQSVSAPQMASRIFKKKYLEKTISLPPRKIVFAGLHSYHGGKNNLTVKPGLYKNICVLDIISAYPHAMAQLPSFYHPELFYGVKGSTVKNWESVNPYGVYRVKGSAKTCQWPMIYDHAFKPICGSKFSDTWITGFEMVEGLRSGELTIEEFFGYCYDYTKDADDSPFAKYAMHYFQEKDSAENDIKRQFNKILLNSLYGKFIQKNQLSTEYFMLMDLDTNTLHQGGLDFEAGGLFNPFIATLITGFVRANLHRLEHKYKALHTSTDSVFTQTRPKTLPGGLGGLKEEFYGDMLIFRNKLYIGYSSKPGKKIIESKLFPGKYISKYALHGFHGNVLELERLALTGERVYSYTKVNKLKESHNRGLRVNAFDPRESKLNIGGLDGIER